MHAAEPNKLAHDQWDADVQGNQRLLNICTVTVGNYVLLLLLQNTI